MSENYDLYVGMMWHQFFQKYAEFLEVDIIKSYVLDMQDGILPPPLENGKRT